MTYSTITKFKLGLFKLVVRLVARRASRVQRLIKYIAITRIRSHFDLPLEGDNETLDDNLYETVNTYFSETPKTQIKSSENKHCKFSEWLHNDPLSDNDRKTYLRISYWFNTGLIDEDKAQNTLSKYKSLYDETLTSPSDSDIWKAYSNLLKRYRSEERALRDSKAQLINLDLKELTLLLSCLSITFVIAGYIYTNILYSHFGIEVEQFFSVSEYLASSIEQIRHALIGLVGWCLGMMHAFRNYTTKTKYEREQQTRLREKIYGWGLYAVCAVYLYMAYTETWQIPLDFTPVAIMVITLRPIHYLSVYYFNQPLPVFFISVFLIGFFSSLYIGTHSRIESIERGHSSMNFEIEVKNKKHTHENSTFVGGNARYIFLRDQSDSIEVILIEKTDRIRIYPHD